MRGTEGDAGASAWARYRVLSAEHRHERLVARSVVAVAAGAIAAAFEPWAGPPVVVCVFVAQVWYGRCRPSAAGGWRRGALAERRTGRVLGALDAEAYRVLHDRALPGAPAANLDHLVVGLTGVYAIASRRWGRRVRLQSDRRHLRAGDRPLLDLPAAAARAAKAVAETLAAELDAEVVVSAVVAVHGARLPRDGLSHAGVRFHPVRRLPEHIRTGPEVYSSAQVATIAAAAERLLPPMRHT